MNTSSYPCIKYRQKRRMIDMKKLKSVKVPNEWEKAEKGYKVSVPYNKKMGILKQIPNFVKSMEITTDAIVLHSSLCPTLKTNEGVFLIFEGR